MSVTQDLSRRRALVGMAGAAGAAGLAGMAITNATPATARPAPTRRWPTPVRSWVFTESTYYQGFRAAQLHRLAGRGGRFYTMNAGEAAYSLRYKDYRDESGTRPLWVIPVTDPEQAPDGSAQLLRLWHPRRQTQMRTHSAEAAEYAVQQLGYRLEAEYPAPYVFTAKVDPEAVPYQFERLWRPA
ncbi:hypothetical protein LWF15_12035 [Kineosporia rhizophila]|uniref:hypothetical protein n=1 Tax=Kineosporia TaxID=49184 RepID=UPI001E6337E7|nr:MULTISPECIES: hypothetical protein [Kineosporia]MCE0536237.1 hypothetical protein [Kineosporia rhizophila]